MIPFEKRNRKVNGKSKSPGELLPKERLSRRVSDKEFIVVPKNKQESCYISIKLLNRLIDENAESVSISFNPKKNQILLKPEKDSSGFRIVPKGWRGVGITAKLSTVLEPGKYFLTGRKNLLFTKG